MLRQFSMTLQTEILSAEFSDSLKQIVCLRPLNSVFINAQGTSKTGLGITMLHMKDSC